MRHSCRRRRLAMCQVLVKPSGVLRLDLPGSASRAGQTVSAGHEHSVRVPAANTGTLGTTNGQRPVPRAPALSRRPVVTC